MRERPSVNLTELLPDITQRPITVITKTEQQLKLQHPSLPQVTLPLPLAATKVQLAMFPTFATAKAKAAAATALETAVAATVLVTADVAVAVADADPADC